MEMSMSPIDDPDQPPSDARYLFWKQVVCPTACRLETFFWNLLWFLVIACLLFGYNPFG
jgi:hypothetical protein